MKTPQNISVSISWSKTYHQAYISLSLIEPVSKEILMENILNEIKKQGIEYGIQEKRIESIVTQLLKSYFVDKVLFATGKKPSSGKRASINFSVKTYNQNDFGSAFNLKDKKYLHYMHLREFIPDPKIVYPHTNVGTFKNKRDGEDGCNIFGEVIEGKKHTDVTDLLGKGLKADKDTGFIMTTEKGILISGEEKNYIFPVLVDSITHLKISQDNLKAYLYIVPPGPNGKRISTQQILQLIKENNIVYGIKHNLISKLTQNAYSNRDKKEKIIIAEGKKPVHGKNTMLNYLVNISFTKIPSITLDERADYFNIHTFESVTKGQHIAEILPLTKGEDGKDVFGTIIPAVPGEKMKLTLGKNVSISEEDKFIIISDVDGHVYLNKNTLFVEEILVIDSNIDFNTGNIDFKGDIVIKGDVLSGFSVNSGSSVYINGIVDDAKISARGNVVIKGGFIGRGKGKIKADNDVIVKNVLNQTIIAKNNILIETESVEANLYAGNSILIEKQRSWCIGGSVVACKAMSIFNIGTELNNKTSIYCGISHFVKKLLQELELDIQSLNYEINNLTNKKKQLLTDTESETEETKKFRTALEKTLAEKKEEFINKKKQYEKNEKYLQLVFNDNNGEISVPGTIYPDVKIKLGNNTYVTNEELKRCTFFSKEDKIYIRYLNNNIEKEVSI